MATTDLIGRNYGINPSWEDLRVPVTSTTVAGSHPPSFARVKDNGGTGTGYALSFDGTNDFATIPHADSGATPVFDFASSWSVSFWAFIPANVGNNKYLFYHPSWSISTRNPGNLRVTVLGKGTTDTGAIKYSPDQRNHIVLIVTETSTTNAKLYINDTLAIDTTWAGTLSADGGNDVSVGYDSSSGFIRMVLDNVRFFNVALSDANVETLWNSGDGSEGDVLPNDTTSFYGLNDGTGLVAVDNIYPDETTHEMTLSGTLWVPGMVETGGSQGVFAYHFSPDYEQELYFIVQMPHLWIEYASVHPHIHWCVEDDEAGDVVWGLEYSWANVNQVFPDTTIISQASSASGAYKHVLGELAAIEGLDKTVSSTLICRLFRDVTSVWDTYAGEAILLELDFHYQFFDTGTYPEYYR